MRVILTTDQASKRFYWPAETERDLPDAEAIRLIESGQAVPARSGGVETTSIAAPADDDRVETTTRRRGRPRKSVAAT